MEYRFRQAELVVVIILSIVVGLSIGGIVGLPKTSGSQFETNYYILLGVSFFPLMIMVLRHRYRIRRKLNK